MKTTIAITQETKEMINKLGDKGETYDEILVKMAEVYEQFLDEFYATIENKKNFKRLK